MKYTFLLKISFFLTLFITLYVFIFSALGKSVIESQIRENFTKYIIEDFEIRNFEFNQDILSFNLFVKNREVLRVNGTLSIFLFSFSGKYLLHNFNLTWLDKNRQELFLSGKGEFDLGILNQEFFSNLQTNNKESLDFTIKKSSFSDELFFSWQFQDISVSTIDNLLQNKNFSILNNFIVGKATTSGEMNLELDGDEVNFIDGRGKHILQGDFAKAFFYSFLLDSTMSPYKIPFLLNLDTFLENDELNLEFEFLNDIFSFYGSKTIYNMQNYDLSSDLNINIQNLSQLKPFVGIDLVDYLDLNGTLKKNRNKFYTYSAYSKRLKGDILTTYQNKKLEIKFKNILFEKILTLFRYYPYIHGETNLHFLYNFTYNILEFKGEINDASIESNFILNQLDKIFNKNLNRSIYKNIRFKGYLRENKIIASILMDTQEKEHFVFENLAINLDRNYIYAPFKMNIGSYGTLSLLLKGDADNPKIEMQVSEENREIIKSFISQESQSLEEENLIKELFDIL